MAKRSRLLIERIKEQPIVHQRAAENALPRSTNKYTKMSAAHFCNALFCAQFFWRFIFATVYFARSFFDYLLLQQFILRQFFLIAKINSQKKSAQKIFAYLFLH